MRVDGILFAVVAEKLNACTHTVAGKKKKERHYLTLAAQYLNNSNTSAAGKKKEFVSTRFLGFARNDTPFFLSC